MIEQDIKKGIRLSGNRDSIVQLMTVLLDNAVKYTESGGVIRAELYGNEKNITLSIANTCEPIDHPEKLFDRFYRVDKARSRAAGGTGLGLSIVRDTVLQHGGAVTARRREPEGTCFEVSFAQWNGEEVGR